MEENYSEVDDDEDLADQVLHAYLNPKLPYDEDLNDEKGFWEGVCGFNGRFKNMKLETL